MVTGISKRELGDFRGAIVDFDKTLSLNYSQLGHEFALVNRAQCKGKLGDNMGAIKDLNTLIEKNPYNSTALYNRGVNKIDLKDYRGALSDFNKAIDINGNYADAFAGRGFAKIKLGQKESGCLDLSKAGELGYENAYDLIREFCNN